MRRFLCCYYNRSYFFLNIDSRSHRRRRKECAHIRADQSTPGKFGCEMYGDHEKAHDAHPAEYEKYISQGMAARFIPKIGCFRSSSGAAYLSKP